MRNVLSLVALAALLVFIPIWVLAWVGLPVGRLALVSFGIVGTATGLLSIGQALMPRWERDLCYGRDGRTTVRMGRLSSLGFGLGFASVGVVLLGAGWLTEYIWPWFLVAFAAGFGIALVGMECDRRAAEAARAAVRQRGWLMASRRKDDDLHADKAQRRQDARAELQRSIQGHLTGRTTVEQAESQHRCLVGGAGDAECPSDWPEVVEEWAGFRSAFAEGDEIWGFNTVSARQGHARGKAGFARLREGSVVDWFITPVVG